MLPKRLKNSYYLSVVAFQTTEETWDKIFDVNVKSQFFFVKEAAPHLEKRNGRGSIILISSVGAYMPIAAVSIDLNHYSQGIINFKLFLAGISGCVRP